MRGPELTLSEDEFEKGLIDLPKLQGGSFDPCRVPLGRLLNSLDHGD